MGFLAQVGGAPYDIVAARLNAGYPCRPVALQKHIDTIAHSHRIGGADTAQPHIPLDVTFKGLSVVGEDDKRAAGGADDECVHTTAGRAAVRSDGHYLFLFLGVHFVDAADILVV